MGESVDVCADWRRGRGLLEDVLGIVGLISCGGGEHGVMKEGRLMVRHRIPSI
jgi:hypothetical protein